MVETLPSSGVDVGLIPGGGPKITYAPWPKKQNNKQKPRKEYCNKFNRFFKWPTSKKKNLKVTELR